MDATTIINIKMIKSFLRIMNKYCDDNGIESTFESFLYHGFNGITSNTYKFLHIIPWEYLVNSKAFIEYYKKVDVDFQKDLMSIAEINQTYRSMLHNSELITYLREVMRNDSRL